MEIFSTKMFVTTFHCSYLLQSNIGSVFLPIWAFSQSFLIFWRVWCVLLNLLSMRIRYLKLTARFYAYESYFIYSTHRRLFHNFFSIPLIITSGMEKNLWNKRLWFYVTSMEVVSTNIYFEAHVSSLEFFTVLII